MSVMPPPNVKCYVTPPHGGRQDLGPFLAWSGTTMQTNVSQNFGRQGDTATIVLVDDYAAEVPGFHHSPGGPHFHVPPLSSIQVIDEGAVSQPAAGIVFAGLVTNPQWRWTAPGRIEWTLQCVDYAFYADHAIAQGKFVGMHAHDIIVELTESADCGIKAATVAKGGHVYPGPLLHVVTMNYGQLSAHWNSITKLASQGEVYGWFVDSNRNLWWFPTSRSFASGVTVTDSPVAPNPNIYECQIDPSMQVFYEYDATTFYTRCLVRGQTTTQTFSLPKAKKSSRRSRTSTAKVPSPPTQTWVANGTQSSWTLDHAPDTTNKAIAASSTSIKAEQSSFYLTVGGAAQEVQVYDGTTPVTSGWQIAQSAEGTWALSVTSSGSVPASGVTLQFWYRYQTTVTAGANNTAQEQRIGGPNGGRFAEVIDDSSITTVAGAYARAKAEVAEFSAPQERLDCYTAASWLGVFRVGQTFNLNSSLIPDSQNGFKPGLRGRFFVIQMMTTLKPGGYRSSHVIAVRQS